jgi:hypothetical protein
VATMPQHSFGDSSRAWATIWSYRSALIRIFRRGYQHGLHRFGTTRVY